MMGEIKFQVLISYSFVLLQTYLVWQIFFSIVFLGRRYSVNQILGCTLVGLGVIVSVARLVRSVLFLDTKATCFTFGRIRSTIIVFAVDQVLLIH